MAWADELNRRYPPDPSAATGVYRVLRTGQPELYPEITDAMLAASVRDAEQLALTRAIGFSSALIVPLQARDRTLGAITLVAAESGRHYGEADMALAQDLARRAALAIESARLYREVGAQRERFAVTLGSIGDAVIATDTAGQVTFMNTVAETLTGWPQGEAGGQDLERVFRIVQESTRAPIESPVARVLREGTVVGLANSTALLARDGVERPIEDSAAPIRDEHGQTLGVVLVFRDVTERKRSEEIRRAKEAAEEANLAKNEFLSRMSHELRTPLNAVLGFGQVLELDELSAEQRESVRYILRGGRHLLELINEVLNIARIEAGRMSLSPEPVPLEDLLLESLALIRSMAGQQQIRIPATLPESCRLHVLADRQRLQQVLLNLLTNAVKYNRAGGTVRLHCEEVGGDRVRLVVADTGAGLAPDQIARLFTPFERLGAEQSGVEGSGLGLALSRRLIEAMGGAIGVESTAGEGTAFWVELPRVESPVARLARLGDEALLPAGVNGADGPAQRVLAAGARDFLTKPLDPVEVLLRVRNLLETRFLHRQLQRQNAVLEERIRERTRELRLAQLAILERLAQAAEYRDDDTGRHTQRVGRLAALLAGDLGLPAEQVEQIRRAAPLHDVGKIGIPDAILLKPGSSTRPSRTRCCAWSAAPSSPR